MTSPEEIESYFNRLFPLHRSLTGMGVRQTHDILAELLPLERIEIPSGTEVFDWTVPKEWNVRQAYVIDPAGKRILDVAENNLHLLNYSAPFKGTITLGELDNHLYSRPDLPDAIPYATSYYENRWGFCISHSQREALVDGNYEVVIDTELFDGSMTLSEAVLPGDSDREVLISTYTCHPSMANHELSGPLTAAFLYRRLAKKRRKYTYRFVFLPETIGSIAYLSLRGEHLKKHTIAGYVATCLGLGREYTYKKSKRADTLSDRAAPFALARLGEVLNILEFDPMGSDERQYCSDGFALPIGSIMRTKYLDFPEYHTSLDNRSLISFDTLAESIEAYLSVCDVIEMNGVYRNLFIQGEPNLGKRGLYPSMGAVPDHREWVRAILWFLHFSDGERDLIAISIKSGCKLDLLHQIAEACVAKGVVETVTASQA